MSNATTNAVITTTMQSVIGTMNEDMFGAIAVNNFGWHYYVDHIEELGLSNIRFPGGTVSERGWVQNGRIRLDGGEISLETLSGDRSQFAFDLTHPELISPLALNYDDTHFLTRDDVGTFSQALAQAVENDVTLDLIIPIQRYFLNANLSIPSVRQQAASAAVSDITVFLERLKSGDYNNGDYPSSITFEIGNEFYKNPIEAAIISKAMIDTITQTMSGSDVSYEIAIQMGRGEFEFYNLLRSGYFDPYFDGSHELVPGLDTLQFTPRMGLDPSIRQIAIDEMMISVLGDSIQHVDAIRHHILGFSADDLDNPNAPISRRGEIVDRWMDAFELQGVSQDDVDYYISAFSTNTSNGLDLPYELVGAANTLEIFAHMLEIGVDRAAIWGVVAAFRYKDSISTTTVTDRLSNFDSPQAAILELLSDNVSTADFLGSYGDADLGYRSFVFENETDYKVFFYAEDVGGSEFKLDVDLGIFADLDLISATNLDIRNGGLNRASELTRTNLPTSDGVVQVSFDQNFEIVMLSLEKANSASYQMHGAIESLLRSEIARDDFGQAIRGDETSETISGLSTSDIIFGDQGHDAIDGGAGRTGFFNQGFLSANFDLAGRNNGDFLFGGEGDDLLHGNAGNDMLSGDEGNDDLWGGSGFDTFIFTQGRDRINDFDSGIDKILIDAELFVNDVDFVIWLEQITTVQDEAFVFDFGSNNQLTVMGASDLSEVLESIQLRPIDVPDLSW